METGFAEGYDLCVGGGVGIAEDSVLTTADDLLVVDDDCAYGDFAVGFGGLGFGDGGSEVGQVGRHFKLIRCSYICSAIHFYEEAQLNMSKKKSGIVRFTLDRDNPSKLTPAQMKQLRELNTAISITAMLLLVPEELCGIGLGGWWANLKTRTSSYAGSCWERQCRVPRPQTRSTAWMPTIW